MIVTHCRIAWSCSVLSLSHVCSAGVRPGLRGRRGTHEALYPAVTVRSVRAMGASMKRLITIPASLLALGLLAVALQLARGAASAPHRAAQVPGKAGEPRRARVTIRVPGLDVDPDHIPKRPLEWLFVQHEPSGSRTLPCELKGLGPVLALRHYLAEKQWASLTARGDQGPILARFEIVDAQSGMNPPYPAEELPHYRGGPYTVTAVLYWADLSAGDRATPLATYLEREMGSGGEVVAVREAGPSVTRVRAEWVEYTVAPRSSRWQGRKGQQRLAIGETGWIIRGTPHIMGEGASRCGWADDVVPIYDLSVSRPTP